MFEYFLIIFLYYNIHNTKTASRYESYNLIFFYYLMSYNIKIFVCYSIIGLLFDNKKLVNISTIKI